MQSNKDGINKVPKKTSAKERLSRDQLLLALEKKKRCNGRAQLIVEEFIDPVTDEERFLERLQYITQSHYEDIVDERHVSLLCGYPFCHEKLIEVPKQKYLVSRATNQVYDITDRKKFCSSNCFRASNFVHAQLLTSPLWLRDQEPIPVFRLMDGWRQKASEKACNATAIEHTDAALQSSSVLPIVEDMQQMRISSSAENGAEMAELHQRVEKLQIINSTI